jgi:hypothetical protein
MLVVLAIIVIVTGIALVGQTSFNRSMLVTDTAYTVALSIRQAQSLGLSSRVFSGIQNAGYGIRFNNGTTGSYTSYVDISPQASGNSQNASLCPGHTITSGPEARPGNCYYDTASELLQTYTFRRGFKIGKFCGTTSAGTEYCSDGTLSSLDIVFLRPNIETILTGNNASLRFSSAYVRIDSPDSVGQRCVTVTSLGAISVNTTCPVSGAGGSGVGGGGGGGYYGGGGGGYGGGGGGGRNIQMY